MRTNFLVSGGEVIAHAGPAERDPEIGGMLLQIVDVGIRWDFGIAGKEVAGGIEGCEFAFRSEVEDPIERDAGTPLANGVVQQLVERISIEPRLERCRRRRDHTGGRNGGERRRPFEKVSAIEVHDSCAAFHKPYQNEYRRPSCMTRAGLLPVMVPALALSSAAFGRLKLT